MSTFITLIFSYILTLLSSVTYSSTSISSTLPADIIYGVSISLTFSYDSDDPLYNISKTDASKMKSILHDIISDQIDTIFDMNTITNCMQHSTDATTLKTTKTQSILNLIIIACSHEVEDQLLLLYSVNSTLIDEFLDELQSQTSLVDLVLIDEVLMHVDTINASDIHPILSTNTANDVIEKELNKIWFINTVYIGTAFVASCIIFIILFMCCIHKKRASKQTKQNMDNLQQEMELGCNAPGLSRMRSLSSSPGSPELPPTTPDALGVNYTRSEHYLVYGTEDIRTLTPSPYPMRAVKGANDVDFVQHKSTKKRILKPLPKNKRVEIADDEAVHIPRIKFSDLDLHLDADDDDDDADPELSYSP